MKCGCCGKEIVYAGGPVPHFSSTIVVQDLEAPHRFHKCAGVNGAIDFHSWLYVVPLYDGRLIMAMQLSLN